MTCKKLIFRFSAIKLVQCFFVSFFFTCYTLFLFENGLNKFEINLVNASYMFCVFLFEIPTGICADLYGRKLSIMIAYALETVGHLVYGFSYSFPMFILAELIIAVGHTFFSGAYDALVADEIKEADDAPENPDLFIKTAFYNTELFESFAKLIGGFCGGFIGLYSLRIGWFISSFGSVAAFALTMFLIPENKIITMRKKEKAQSFWAEVKQGIKNQFVISVKHGYKNKIVVMVAIIGCFWAFGLQALNMYWTKHFEDMGGRALVKESWLLIEGFICFGILSVKRLKNFPDFERIILFCCLMGAGIFACLSSLKINLIAVIVLFSCHEIFRGIYSPIYKAYSNSHIPSEVRATVLSFISMIGYFGNFLGLLISGLIAEYYSINASWLFSGLVLILSAFLVVKLPNGILRKKA